MKKKLNWKRNGNIEKEQISQNKKENIKKIATYKNLEKCLIKIGRSSKTLNIIIKSDDKVKISKPEIKVIAVKMLIEI
jgi:hypothetical protein